jgi:hypothetical protein
LPTFDARALTWPERERVLRRLFALVCARDGAGDAVPLPPP